MRWTRTHDRAMVVFIFCACCMSLNVLFGKIRRMVEIRDLERKSEREAQIASIVYYNSTLAGETPSLYLLIYSEDGSLPAETICETRNRSHNFKNPIRAIHLTTPNVFYGVCDSVTEPDQVSMHIDDFHVAVEPQSLSSPLRDVVCLSYVLLYEDISTFRALLQYYSQRSDLMVLYVGSMSDEVFAETTPYKWKIEVVAWPVFSKRLKLSPDVLPLSKELHHISQTTAFTDCWLRYAPISQRITMADVAAIRFPSASTDNTDGDSIFKHLQPSWTIAQLLSHRIVENRYDELVIAERCYARTEVFSWRSDCEEMIPGVKQNSSLETISLRKASAHPSSVNAYQGDIQRCVSHKPVVSEPRTVMKLEFDLDKRRQELDPCELRLRRDKLKCRVAVDYSNLMFRARMKISVVKKRSVLLFLDGCHL
uniref:Glycosyltransferase family 92 protein n=2 Tax=Haemonchus contortus TaxID=6289 RepID=A0A7I5EAJ9_HAECO